MLIQPKDDEDAEDGTEFKLGAFPNPSLDECPLVFLGHHDGRVVIAMPEGDIRDEPAANIPRLLNVDLFNCAAGSAFLTHWRDSEEKLQRDLCANWVVRKCRAAGFWDTSRPQRALGVWPGPDGTTVLHRGDALNIYTASGDPQKTETISIAAAMRRKNGPIYVLRAPAPIPGEPATVADGLLVRNKLDLWRFAPIGDEGMTGADVVAGWLICSLLGAVAPFRPHVLLYAMWGSGKTKLVYYLHGLLSTLAGDVIDSFTPAGLRNELAGMARPVMIDEAEAQPNAPPGQGAIEQALEVIRRMATGDGAVRKQGDLGGKSTTQTAVGSAFLAAVNPVKLGQADASRFAEVKLLPLTQAAVPGDDTPQLATEAQLEDELVAAKALAPKLLARVLVNAGRYKADVAAIKAVLVSQGESPRSADLVAALAAGRHLLLSDEALTEETASEEAKFWSGLLVARAAADSGLNTGQECVEHLFSWQSGMHVDNRIVTLSELIRAAADRDRDFDMRDCANVLAVHGIKIKEERDETDGEMKQWLLVANQHSVLTKVYAGTRWQDWRRTFEFLDALGDAHRTRQSPNAVYFNLHRSRATCIPLAPWLEPARTNE
jgi:hypothetical protein